MILRRLAVGARRRSSFVRLEGRGRYGSVDASPIQVIVKDSRCWHFANWQSSSSSHTKDCRPVVMFSFRRFCAFVARSARRHGLLFFLELPTRKPLRTCSLDSSPISLGISSSKKHSDKSRYSSFSNEPIDPGNFSKLWHALRSSTRSSASVPMASGMDSMREMPLRLRYLRFLHAKTFLSRSLSPTSSMWCFLDLFHRPSCTTLEGIIRRRCLCHDPKT
ncbi:Os01g0947767 [Oryza sativa Japonica Group]|uniref:Os01g0947767 protein n=1 Tax=Oryza sativa subsp. japonica TaxID=39947 RepID=A0A0P0VCV5_ORYSJ|nr:hypothetical protein EE612_007955 [Oryza sativa]BAS76208.1 Os01g0947767 [Oryza sativa Japonica Group]